MKILHVAAGLLMLAFGPGCSAEDPPGNQTGGTGPGQSGATSTSGAGQGSGGGGAGQSGVGGSVSTAGVGGGGGGAPPVAGSAGQGQGGSAGSGGSGTAGAGGGDATKSAGCGRMEPLQQEPRMYVKHEMTVDVAAAYQPAYTTRQYHTYLPENYDPNRAYPLYFWGNGCGVQKDKPEGIPASDLAEVKTGAILVFMIQIESCFDAGKGGLADTPDVPYFTKMLDTMEAEYCVDKSKVFVGGYSSGAWFASTLSCSHGDRINAIGMAAGGQQDELPTCKGQTALALWAATDDGGNPIETPANVPWKGSGAVRDRLITANGCATTHTKWDPMWPACDVYDNCGKHPVVFCPHTLGHDRGDGTKMSSEGFWKLFKSTW